MANHIRCQKLIFKSLGEFSKVVTGSRKTMSGKNTGLKPCPVSYGVSTAVDLPVRCLWWGE
jgi:hypothetical protein